MRLRTIADEYPLPEWRQSSGIVDGGSRRAFEPAEERSARQADLSTAPPVRDLAAPDHVVQQVPAEPEEPRGLLDGHHVGGFGLSARRVVHAGDYWQGAHHAVTPGQAAI